MRFKAHKNSSRIYELRGDKAAIFFTKAVLERCLWIVVEVGECP